MSVSLRDYQQKLVSQTYHQLNNGRRRLIISSSVGSGKTRTAARICFDVLSKGKRVLFLAHRKELVTQPRDTFKSFGMDPGIIKAGFPFEPEKPLQIASVQTLVNILDQIHAPDVIIVDEAHHSVAGTWDQILSFFPEAIVIGLSGTPERTDGTGLAETFEMMIEGPQIPWLIENGFLVDCDVFGATDRVKIPKPKPGQEYDPAKVLAAIQRRSIDGNALMMFNRFFTKDERVALFSPTVEHAKQMAQRFQNNGIRAAWLSGETKDQERDETLAGFASGYIRVVANVDVIGEGTDIPAIEGIIDLSRTSSLVRYLQRAGRALRPSEGKTTARYIDLVGNVVEHGHPCIERLWSLEGAEGRKKREDAEKTENGEHLSTRQCGTCGANYPSAPVCPYCESDNGQERRLSRERATEIRKLEKEEIEAARRAAAAARVAEERACKSLSEMKALGARRGNKPGWAFVKWKEMDKLRSRGRNNAA